MLGGFPCQAFSIAGLREGFKDRKGRGELFFQLERIFLEKKPKIKDTILEITALRGKNRLTSEENSLHQKPYILIDEQ